LRRIYLTSAPRPRGGIWCWRPLKLPPQPVAAWRRSFPLSHAHTSSRPDARQQPGAGSSHGGAGECIDYSGYRASKHSRFQPLRRSCLRLRHSSIRKAVCISSRTGLPGSRKTSRADALLQETWRRGSSSHCPSKLLERSHLSVLS
jgi:hypothetical protein